MTAKGMTSPTGNDVGFVLCKTTRLAGKITCQPRFFVAEFVRFQMLVTRRPIAHKIGYSGRDVHEDGLEAI